MNCATRSVFILTLALSVSAFATENQCDTNFQETYLAKRGCVFENDQRDCFNFGLRSAAFPLLTAGAAAAGAAGAAKIFNDFLQKKLGSPEKMKAAMQEVKRALTAKDAATALDEKVGSAALADQEVFGQTFKNRSERLEAILRKVKPDAAKGMDLAQLQKTDPQAFQESVELLKKLKETQKKILLSQTDDPYVKARIRQNFGDVDASVEKPVEIALKKFFPAENVMKRSKSLARVNTPEWEKLTPDEKFINEMLASEYKPPSAIDGGSGPRLMEESSANLKASSGGVKAGLAGAAAAAALPAVGEAGLTFVDKQRIKACQKDLGLSNAETDQLANSYQYLGFAQTESDTFDGDCSHIRLRTPKASLDQAKAANKGQVPDGLCHIIKNEMAQMDRLFGKEMPSLSASCEKFSAANVKLTGPADHRKFEYNDGGYIHEANWDSNANSPDLRHVKIYDANGNESRVAEINFSNRYLATHSPGDLSDKDPGQHDINACLAVNEKSATCDIVHAALKARVYSSIASASCSAPGDTTASKAKSGRESSALGVQ